MNQTLRLSNNTNAEHLRLQTPGSVPELAMRHCVLGKDTLRCFQCGPSTLPRMVASLTKNLQTESKRW